MSFRDIQWKAVLIGVAVAVVGELVGGAILFEFWPKPGNFKSIIPFPLLLFVALPLPLVIAGYVTGMFSAGAEIINSTVLGLIAALPAILLSSAVHGEVSLIILNLDPLSIAIILAIGFLAIVCTTLGGWIRKKWSNRGVLMSGE